MKPKFILCLALVLSFVLAGCTTSPKLAKILISGHGNEITIRESWKLHHITVPEDGDIVNIDKVSLIDQQTKGEFRYFYLFVSGASRPGGNGLGWCGSGIESRVVWAKLKDWRIVDFRQQRVESCLEGVGLIESGNWKDEIYAMVFSSPYGINKITLQYNPAKPEQAFILNTNSYNL